MQYHTVQNPYTHFDSAMTLFEIIIFAFKI